ncbi:MAG: hypothetical protein HQ503_14305 [Rhodospirillales bacterium]|nr:hypothetical protein [Rhodospirillales bacterium]
MVRRRIFTFTLIVALALGLVGSLAACGKKASLDPPPGEGGTYPRTYPSK